MKEILPKTGDEIKFNGCWAEILRVISEPPESPFDYTLLVRTSSGGPGWDYQIHRRRGGNWIMFAGHYDWQHPGYDGQIYHVVEEIGVTISTIG